MSAICQNTLLNSPLNNALLLEGNNCVQMNLTPRNNCIKAFTYYIKELKKFVDLEITDSNFTQNFNSISSKLINVNYLKETEDNFEHHRDLLIQITKHPYYNQLISSYKWKWFLENLVITSFRP